MTTRRTFLETVAGGLTAAVAGSRLAFAGAQKPPLGLQLWSVRAALMKDLPGTLKQVKVWGIDEVESAGFGRGTAAEFAATVSIGDEIGFLPGTEEEKMTPWMGALTDNIEVLTQSDEGGEWGRAATNDLLASRIKIRSMSFMRGRTFLNRYVIIDEAQNLTPHEVKTIITRAGEGTKVIYTGDINQIDTPYMDEHSNGLTYLIDRLKGNPLFAHVKLEKGERSELANLANEML